MVGDFHFYFLSYFWKAKTDNLNCRGYGLPIIAAPENDFTTSAFAPPPPNQPPVYDRKNP